MTNLNEPWVIRPGIDGPTVEDADGHTRYIEGQTERAVDTINACAGVEFDGDSYGAVLQLIRASARAAQWAFVEDHQLEEGELEEGYEDLAALQHALNRFKT